MALQNRRDFLRNAAVYSASISAGLTAAGLFPRRIPAESTGFNRVMYRELGSTGFRVSEVGFGAFGNMSMEDPDMVRAAIDRGVNYIDTAHSYMNGRNEEVVGEAMKTMRDGVFLTSKVRWRNPETMLARMETSLKRLNTDHVDLFLLHDIRSKEYVTDERFIEIFDTARRKGICRFVGISTHADQAAILDAAVAGGFWEAVLAGYNALSPPPVGAAIERARKAGLAVIAMKVFLNPATWPWEPLEDIRTDGDGDISAHQALMPALTE